jgi:hypothetical protein
MNLDTCRTIMLTELGHPPLGLDFITFLRERT